MSLELKGIVKHVGEIEEVSSTFKKRMLVINTGGQYSKDVAFECVQDKTMLLDKVIEGEEVLVKFDPMSREHNGRWFTALKPWKIESL